MEILHFDYIYQFILHPLIFIVVFLQTLFLLFLHLWHMFIHLIISSKFLNPFV